MLHRKLDLDDEGTAPTHRRQYRCAELELCANPESLELASASGQRLYIVVACGHFLPSYTGSPDAPENKRQVGCDNLVATLDTIKLKYGSSTATTKEIRREGVA